MSGKRSLRLKARGSSCCLRAKASKRRTSSAPRSLAPIASAQARGPPARVLLEQQFEVAEIDCEKIVEVVGDAAGQLADRFHPL